MKRREFIHTSGLFTAGTAMAGLSLSTLQNEGNSRKERGETSGALYEKGKPTTYLKSKNELQYIGMPVGGIMCGMLYLGGDGRLWLWDVFNKNQTGVVYKEIPWHETVQTNGPYLRSFDGANYVQPVKDVRPLDQGFALCFEFDDKKIIKKLEANDWDEIAFEATYPMAAIHYTIKEVPVKLTINVYSPFIPLNEDESGLPATIYSFHLHNDSEKPVTVSITGWLENKSSIYTAAPGDEQYFKLNTVIEKENFSSVIETTQTRNWADDNFYFTPDHGDFCIASFNPSAIINTGNDTTKIDDLFFKKENKKDTISRKAEKSLASVCNHATLNPGEKKELNYCLSWYFPNLSFHSIKNENLRYYAKKFKSSAEVNEYVYTNFERLSTLTKSWCNNYYNKSTLPYWFLERTLLNISTLATTTSHRFSSGRFYAWEGVGSCAGTCTHVWQYAQAMARIFPNLERDTRERVDFGLSFHEDGHVGLRAEYDPQPAIDGQAGRILGVYREHKMTTDNSFLKRLWPNVKKGVDFILIQDTNGNGMVDTQLENTLDAKWPGEIAWIVGLCLAAVKAGQLMAEEMNDIPYAEKCKAFFEKGKANMEKELFNGEYFIHKPDPKLGKTVLGSYNTCHIDQVYGQAWAFQAGIDERIIDRAKTLSALKALWKNNFLTDVGPYLQTHHGGRAYALPGEGGMLMNTNPKNEDLPYGVKDAWQVTYFHECMSGFEHQVAAHMMAEGMVDEALLLTKTIHERYSGVKRNPFNEVECSDHYARAMASYGTYISACGFDYHGPKKYIHFAPKVNAANFASAFTTAESWGSFSQKKTNNKWTYLLDISHGRLALKTISIQTDLKKIKSSSIKINNEQVIATLRPEQDEVIIEFTNVVEMKEGTQVSIQLA
ncbi:MAG: GH116 family glycosyl-hydrolase [Chitinophagaceae bacterium]